MYLTVTLESRPVAMSHSAPSWLYTYCHTRVPSGRRVPLGPVQAVYNLVTGYIEVLVLPVRLTLGHHPTHVGHIVQHHLTRHTNITIVYRRMHLILIINTYIIQSTFSKGMLRFDQEQITTQVLFWE
jgi:hypothetical protein